MLEGLTGWSLRYFAIVTKFKSKNKRIGSKRYGAADVLLWEKEVDDTATGIKRRGAKVVFRVHEGEFLWISGSVTASTSISTSTGQDATISVSSKNRGQLLDVSKMVAIASETAKASGTGHSRGPSDVHEELADLVLTFENEQCKYESVRVPSPQCQDTNYPSPDRLDFVNLVTRFKVSAATAAPLSRTATGVESMRRVSSLASTDMQMSPPMRGV